MAKAMFRYLIEFSNPPSLPSRVIRVFAKEAAAKLKIKMEVPAPTKKNPKATETVPGYREISFAEWWEQTASEDTKQLWCTGQPPGSFLTYLPDNVQMLCSLKNGEPYETKV